MSVSVPPKSSGDVIATSHEPLFQQLTKKGVLLIGKPCSGKSVVSKRLHKEFGAKHYSSSSALRQYATKHGKIEIIQQMDAGDLVTDTPSIELVSGWHYQDFLAHQPFGIFDGWGRTDTELLYALNRLKSVQDLHVVFLDGTTDCLIERARDRNRGDDNLLLKRINGYCEFFEALNKVAMKRLGEKSVHTIMTTELSEAEVFERLSDHVGLIAA